MRTSIKSRSVVYLVQDGCLVQTVAGADGRTYTHRCVKQTFETVALAVGEMPRDGGGTSQAEVARGETLPYTQVNVALEFLKERGLIDVRHRRCYPATQDDLYLDAMVEYHALAEEDKFV